MPLANAIWLDALGVFTASKIGAYLATCLMVTRVLISRLVNRAPEVDDREMDL